jgi:UDP-2,4-diacetamido-2,4,6-trideoxy-beta-L-altropyranose hydrolase
VSPTTLGPEPVRVALRVDSSAAIGGGHLMRCLALAGELRDRGSDVRFVTTRRTGDMTGRLEDAGFRFGVIEADLRETDDAAATAEMLHGWWDRPADWLGVDSYALGAEWEAAARAAATRLLAIDDLGRVHTCDLLLDHNLGADVERYAETVPSVCRRLLGPAYALLRPEFRRERARLRERGGVVRRGVVSFGAGHDHGMTARAIEAVERLGRPDIAWEVIRGVPETLPAPPNVTLHARVEDMAALLAGVDLALGAGGTSMLERAFLGVPQLVVTLADNQAPGSAAAADAGLAVSLGDWRDVSAERLAAALEAAIAVPAALAAASRRALETLDPAGGTASVARELLAASPVSLGRWRLRPVEERDRELVRRWRNMPSVRRWMYDDSEVAVDEHERWFEAGMADPNVRRLVLEGDERPLGFMALEGVDEDAGTSWGFYLGEASRPHGAGTALGVLALEYAFGRLGVAAVRGEAIAENDASVRFHERLGFIETARGEVPRGGCLRDVVAFEMDADAWRDRREALLRATAEEA